MSGKCVNVGSLASFPRIPTPFSTVSCTFDTFSVVLKFHYCTPRAVAVRSPLPVPLSMRGGVLRGYLPEHFLEGGGEGGVLLVDGDGSHLLCMRLLRELNSTLTPSFFCMKLMQNAERTSSTLRNLLCPLGSRCRLPYACQHVSLLLARERV